MTSPETHWANHVRSAKKLDIGNNHKCTQCEGYGYDCIKAEYLYVRGLGPPEFCTRCGGSGMEPT
jgi:DnaJ-class molecular chaperone